MFRKFICMMCLFSLMGIAEATVQISETMSVVGVDGKMAETGVIEENPMKPWIDNNKAKIEKIEMPMACTANRTGYCATWQLRDGKLFLEDFFRGYKSLDRKDIEACSRIKELFPGLNGPVFADWYTGKVHFGSGKTKHRIHWTISIRETLHVYEIEKGVVKLVKIYKYPDNMDYYKERFSKEDRRKFDILKGVS